MMFFEFNSGKSFIALHGRKVINIIINTHVFDKNMTL